MINHDDFEVNEAWVIFKLGKSPIHTEQDGNFNFYALMDVGSGYIIGHVPSKENESLSRQEVDQLFIKAWNEKKNWPQKIFLEEETTEILVFKEIAQNNEISTRQCSFSELSNITKDPKEQFAKRFGL